MLSSVSFAHRGYLLDISRRIPKLTTFTELVDLLYRERYNEFILYAKDAASFNGVELEKLMSYCEMQGIALTKMDALQWNERLLSGRCVAVSTESARSLAGRVEEMRERMIDAERMGRVRKMDDFVVTDFADEFAWQPLAVSLPGLIMGGNFASAGAKSANMDLEHELDGALGAPLGWMVLELGTLYLRGGARRDNSSEYFNILAGDHGYSRHPGITQFILDEVSGIAHGIRIAAERWLDRSDWAREIAYMAQLIDCACHRRDESRLRQVRDEHGIVWRRRFLEDGRMESLARLPRF